jgi:hypothetical protein
LRFFCNSLIIIGDYNLGCELFILFSDFQGSSNKSDSASNKIKDFFKPINESDPFKLPDIMEDQRKILGLMLEGYTRKEIMGELSISGSVYQRSLAKMRETFEISNNETLLSTLHRLGYASEFIDP